MSVSVSNPDSQKKEKLLELRITDDSTDDLPSLDEFLEEGYRNDFYQDHMISVKIDINESLLPKMVSLYADRIFKGLKRFIENRDEGPQVGPSEGGGHFRNPREDPESGGHLSASPHQNGPSGGPLECELLPEGQLCLPGLSLETLEVRLRYNSEEDILGYPLLGSSLDFLQNIRFYNVYFEGFPKAEGLLSLFSRSYPKSRIWNRLTSLSIMSMCRMRP